MYQIRVRHNYLYKLMAEVNFHFPGAMYQIQDDAIITDDYRIVDVAEYVFQFQPELLVVDYFVTDSEINGESAQKKETFIQRGAFALEPELVKS